MGRPKSGLECHGATLLFRTSRRRRLTR